MIYWSELINGYCLITRRNRPIPAVRQCVRFLVGFPASRHLLDLNVRLQIAIVSGVTELVIKTPKFYVENHLDRLGVAGLYIGQLA